MPQYIVKRDGTKETWNPNKITYAIASALNSSLYSDGTSTDEKDVLNNAQVLKDFVLQHINGAKEISQETVQDLIEHTLMQKGLFKPTKNFIKYREKRREIREQESAFLDIQKTVNDYVEGAD